VKNSEMAYGLGQLATQPKQHGTFRKGVQSITRRFDTTVIFVPTHEIETVYKRYPWNRPWSSIGLQDVEHLTDGRRPLPPQRFLVLISVTD
jgi:hypothetical protein